MATGRRSDGFSLVELLVVIAIVAILAAISIPLFVHQRSRAHDASTQADVNNLAKELETYYIDRVATPVLDFSQAGHVIVTDGVHSSIVNLTNGTAVPTSGAYSGLSGSDTWCVALTDPSGSTKTFRYSAADGLEAGSC